MLFILNLFQIAHISPKVLILKISSLSIISFMDHVFGGVSEMSLPNPKSLAIFSSAFYI